MGTRDEDVFAPNSCRRKFSDLRLDCDTTDPASLFDKCHPPVCQQVCDVYEAWLRPGVGGQQASRRWLRR